MMDIATIMGILSLVIGSFIAGKLGFDSSCRVQNITEATEEAIPRHQSVEAPLRLDLNPKKKIKRKSLTPITEFVDSDEEN